MACVVYFPILQQRSVHGSMWLSYQTSLSILTVVVTLVSTFQRTRAACRVCCSVVHSPGSTSVSWLLTCEHCCCITANTQTKSLTHWENKYCFKYTVRYRYNAVNFFKNIHKRHPIARPLGRGMGCLLLVQPLIDILPQFLQWYM